MMHSVEGGDHVGAYLREARETTGRTVVDVAQSLRIRRVYLEAIEDGRFDELPGATYAVGFVRSYATYLRLDAPTLVARFKEEASGIQAPQELEFPTPVPEGRFPGGLLVTVCLLLAAAAFGGWYWLQSQNGIEVARVPAPPGETETTAPAVTSSSRDAAGETPASGEAPATDEVPDTPEVPAEGTQFETMATAPDVIPQSAAVAPAETATADPTDVAPTAPSTPVAVVETPAIDTSAIETPAIETPAIETPAAEPAPAAEVAVATPAPAEFSSEPAIIALPEIDEPKPDSGTVASDRAGRTFGARNAAARIILRAAENTWVQVRDEDENVVLTQMLQVGDRYLVPNRDGLRLMTGNAGGLDVSVDGESVPAIGESGESRRDVRLDPDRLKSGTAVVR